MDIGSINFESVAATVHGKTRAHDNPPSLDPLDDLHPTNESCKHPLDESVMCPPDETIEYCSYCETTSIHSINSAANCPGTEVSPCSHEEID